MWESIIKNVTEMIINSIIEKREIDSPTSNQLPVSCTKKKKWMAIKSDMTTIILNIPNSGVC